MLIPLKMSGKVPSASLISVADAEERVDDSLVEILKTEFRPRYRTWSLVKMLK